jgi:putative endonuclease
MYYVYILKSSKFQRRIYIGSTNNLKRRFEEHNKGLNKSTKYGIPWKLIYYEAFLSKKDCLKRENNLKNYSSSYRQLKLRISDSLNRA